MRLNVNGSIFLHKKHIKNNFEENEFSERFGKCSFYNCTVVRYQIWLEKYLYPIVVLPMYAGAAAFLSWAEAQKSNWIQNNNAKTEKAS